MTSELSSKILEVSQKVGSLKYGDFVLSSGAKSRYYFDGRLISLNAEGAYLLGKAFLNEIRDSDIASIGGPATAAIPIVTSVALVSHLEGHPVQAFFVRPEEKDHGTGKQVEGGLIPGTRVAILDDVCSTGESLFTAIRAVEKLGCTVIKVMTVLDRHQGGSEEIKLRGYEYVSLLEPDVEGNIRVTG